nr:MAG TPA: terminase small subunit [Caudoviricetes sp.]
MWWCFICRSSPHEAGGGTRTQVLTEQAPGKPDQTRSIPRKGYICRASLREMGAGLKGGEPIVAKGKYQRWLEPDGLLLLEGWARDGLTDEQLAEKIGISATTLYDWKNKFPEFSEAIKKGKEIVDIQVENALLKRALGYEYMEERVEISEKDGRKVIQTVKTVIPDTTAQIFWLKNRRPDKWRDKPEMPGDSDGLKRAKELLEGIPSAID